MADYNREYLISKHQDYKDSLHNWNFHYRSYLGGDDFSLGNFLNRYILETDEEYLKRLDFTPLDNHCRNVVQIYSSFLLKKGRSSIIWIKRPLEYFKRLVYFF